MNYLENSICQFTPLFPINYSSKKNIVSTVFFKMPHSGYKPFTNYLNGIQHLSNTILKKLPNFSLRLFIDPSIHNDPEIMSFLNKIPNLELILFHCPSYTKNNFHRGTFGTLIRFFPMFNFPNNDANHVLVTDIDWSSESNVEDRLRIIKTYNTLQENNDLNNLHLFIDGSIHHLGYQYTYLKELKTIIPILIAAFIINCERIDGKLLENFIGDVDKSGNIYSNYSKDLKHLERKSKNRKFVYGVDEYFLNHVLVQYLEKNKLEFGIRIHYTITNLLFHAIFTRKTKDWQPKVKPNLSKRDIDLFKAFFDFVLDGIDNYKFENLQQAFDLMDKYTYQENIKNKLTEKQQLIFMRVLMFFNYLRKNNIKLLDPIKLNFILDDLAGKVSIDEYRFFFSNKKPIIIEEYKLPANIIEKIKS